MRTVRALPFAVLCGVLLCTACGSHAAPSAQQSPTSSSNSASTSRTLTKIVVSYPEGAAHLPLWYAKDKGYFAKNGLDVDLQELGGGSPAMAALLSNQAQIVDITGTVITAADAAGSDVVALATLDPVYPYVLEVPATIKTTDDLKGKGISIRAPGDATDVAARSALQSLNLVPDKDVKIQAVNSEGARIAAVQAGQICCTVAQPQDAALLEAQGFHVLLDFSTLHLLNAQGVIGVRRSYASANQAAVQAFMNALVQAIAAEKNDKPGSVALIKTYLKLDDDKVAGLLYDYFVGKVIPENPMVTPDQFTSGTAILAQQNDKLKDFDMSKFIDQSFLRNAVASNSTH
jgi:ABC-type nitrate/sulfonate/bicarbonate transport system substrate-binding protein